VDERARAVEGVAVTERAPLISILIPNYNYVQYVATAVDSALAQTYPNFEVIVSDNCSTDGAWELLNERYGDDPRVRLSRNATNVGMAKNFDRLMELARGRYVMCLSSDDFLFPPHLARLEEVFAREPELDVVYCNAYFAREDGAVYAQRALAGQFPVDYVDARDELVENFTTVCPVCLPCALFKREVLLEPGICGDPDNGQAARDWELVIRFALAGKRFAYVAQPSMAIRLHADQSTGDAYHRSGSNVLDFAAYAERYMDHPEFLRRMRGREGHVANFLSGLVAQAPSLNDGVSPFDEAQHARLAALAQRLRARGAEYEPARVRDAKVSVVVQTAAPLRLLVRALDSVAAQRFPNWELVVVDHGAIEAEALLRAHPAWERTSYARLPAAHSSGAARNLALRMIRGEYVAFLDTDNAFAPDHLERAVDAIARSGAEVAVASSRLVIERMHGPAGAPERIAEAPFGGDESDVRLLEVAPSIPLDALVFYRGVLQRSGTFNDTVPFLEDWDFALRVARTAHLVTTNVTTVDIGARLGLAAQRLGVALPHYLAVLDALYAAHAVEPRAQEQRAAHRARVAAALAAVNDWVGEPHGVAAFMRALAGRGERTAPLVRQPA
jgi:glycosyltransferase involved in cell wall biosynthesis